MEIDEGKGTLTVTGDADPYEIIVRTKKAGKFIEVVTVGPPPPPPKPQQDGGQKKADEKKDDKKADEKKPDQKAQDQSQAQSQAQPYIHTPHSCPVCERIDFVQLARWDEQPNPSCSIM